MARTLRVTGSFAIVWSVYCAYTLIAVPLIEPPADVHQSERLSEEELREREREANKRLRKDLEGLFPPDAWELKNPKILEVGQIKLLFETYTRIGNGKKVEIDPCTMIFTPDESGGDDRQQPKTIVLDAPKGAELEFKEAFDLLPGNDGRLKSGILKGRITVRSGGVTPGPNNLTFVTHGAELNEERIWAPNPVSFNLGASHGRGSQMRIKLLAKDHGGTRTSAPNIAGIEMVEVLRLERLHLEPEKKEVPGRPTRSGDAAALDDPALGADLPIEITCDGPFRFNAVELVATFEDRVNVRRIHPVGPDDHLSCERLAVHFARPRSTLSTPAPDDPSPDTRRFDAWTLKPRWIEARGQPVVVRSPSRGVHVRGERLEYDLQTDRIVLDGGETVFLRQGANEIHARQLQYQSLGPGRLGQVIAAGPGRLRGRAGNQPGRQLEARWSEWLHLRPHEGQPVISLTGGAALSFVGVGQMTAAEIHFYLFELPPRSRDDDLEIRPDRMIALGAVTLNGPKMTGSVDELNVWFEQASSDGENAGHGLGRLASAGGAAGGRQGAAPSAGLSPGTVGQATHRAAGYVSSVLASPRFEIDGDRLSARVLIGSQGGELAELALTGRPASFKGRDLGLTASNVNVDVVANRMWIDGPGQMHMPLDRDLEGRLLDRPGRLDIGWQKGMDFDGQTVRFQKSVVAAGRHPRLRMDLQCEIMEVDLLRPVRFSDAEDQPEPEIERITCHGDVLVRNHSYEGAIVSSQDRMEVANLKINQISGETTAEGPGRLTSVRRGSADLLASGAESQNEVEPTAPSHPDDELSYLDVRFQGSLGGNVRHREMSFHDYVHAIYGPVESWESTLTVQQPSELGPDDVLLDCQHLKIVHMPLPSGSGRAVELEADDNVVVMLRAYTFRAPRMTYTEAKDLLILKGNGRTDVEVYHQEHPGASRSRSLAHEIKYWRSTGQCEADFHSLDLSLNQSRDM
ncbi:MAG: hypothetical protein ACYTG0_00045 [Planctomycetota bacterium]|jgi:hypothetical protein